MDVLLAQCDRIAPSFAEIGVAEAIPLGPVERVVMSCLEKIRTCGRPSARDLSRRRSEAIFEDEMNATADEQSPETQAEIIATPAPLKMLAPNTLVYQMEAWMPDRWRRTTARLRADMGRRGLGQSPALIKVRLEDLTGSS